MDIVLVCVIAIPVFILGYQFYTDITTPYQPCTGSAEVIEFHKGGPSQGEHGLGFKSTVFKNVITLQPVICEGDSGPWLSANSHVMNAESIRYVVNEATVNCEPQNVDVVTATSKSFRTLVTTIIIVCE